MGQDHDIKPVGREAVQAVIDIFLNNIQPFTPAATRLSGSISTPTPMAPRSSLEAR